MDLSGKNILLGITGGIAAYKTPILVRLLRQADAEVQVVLTRGAREFITPTTLQAVSGRPVRDDLWDEEAEAAMGHIELARWADLVVVAPATAHFMATLAQGLAPDLLSTLCLATEAQTVVAPAMNQAMWRSPATQRNVDILARDGRLLVGPAEGEQACGDTGPGRMVEPEDLFEVIRQCFAARCLDGLSVLVTAGPTEEAIDPVRHITNRSSGKQGYAMAAAAAAAGAEVTLVSGPCILPPPPGVDVIGVTSAQDMYDAVHARIAAQDLFIGVAAVADFRPAQSTGQKIKKESVGTRFEMAFEENPDIIASVALLPERPLVIGFAAETQKVLEHAREKRRRKGLDAIVVNDVSRQGIGFNSDSNAATLIWADGELALPYQSKQSLAQGLIRHIADIFTARLAGAGQESRAS
ncbi:MAG: bifunctional phosphopantothenoylcysteine decarboxylase/phosphopantothenate--cysteine ligase CoaBC [Gammaproteobacteria bacterium]|nr:bifunctional phosphopantothenoylcysteine decarboxylase/phosphopantothenate--cysteine ligase CoaBC [Gammaproteobacteria bacterium]MDE0367358.1 bifunctional phosphopantothenoylcysteine decarboxylase/phosphopantothenate--cysteine ligase CoaBC [Gammaproteobacteria bacterium]